MNYLIETKQRINPPLLVEQLKAVLGTDVALSTGPYGVCVLFPGDSASNEQKAQADAVLAAHDPDALSAVEQQRADDDAALRAYLDAAPAQGAMQLQALDGEAAVPDTDTAVRILIRRLGLGG